MKKLLFAAVVVVMMVFSVTPAFAHGHGGHHSGYRAAPVNYSVCPVKSCTLSGLHDHDSITYSAHHLNDGHNYHRSHGRHH